MPESPRQSPALDPTVPNVARMYDYMLGGKENYASDRAAVARLVEMAPAVPQFARLNRAFLHRAVRFAASQGISQFLDVGAGLPTQESVHEVARAVRPEARIAYADNDPVVAAHSRALLGSTPGVTFAVGDIRDPASLLADPEISGLLDFSQPVCVLLLAILHFVTDAEDPARLVAAIRDALAPGSYLILSHGTAHGAPPAVAARSGEASRVYDNATSRITYRDPAQVSQFLAGFTLVEPGLVHISRWRPPVPARDEFDGFLAAVGRKD
ncbi:MAG TPA: SAM-dependent methyltransferase [Streptosporangiaceae bacterium]|jgi:SAM-dependent methyltransferase